MVSEVKTYRYLTVYGDNLGDNIEKFLSTRMEISDGVLCESISVQYFHQCL